MPHVEIYNVRKERIRTSRNLRAILDHARRVPVDYAAAMRDSDGGALLHIDFANGDYTRVSFASYTIARNWINSRRSWQLEQMQYDPNVSRWQFPHWSTRREA